MIWFAGIFILQNACCNNGKKNNKTKIKHLVVSAMSFKCAQWVTLSVASVCSLWELFMRDLSRSHMAFFDLCVLHGTAYLEVVREVLKEAKGRNLNIKVNVIELYVIKSWWKIKLNKRKVYHQLVCLLVFFFLVFFFCQLNQHWKILVKLDYVVTELLLRKK